MITKKQVLETAKHITRCDHTNDVYMCGYCTIEYFKIMRMELEDESLIAMLSTSENAKLYWQYILNEIWSEIVARYPGVVADEEE